ncbi:MAG: metal ABC transporter solute-binding protein, Zn/Mn family [Candidatus Muiribacteriota bacterium]
MKKLYSGVFILFISILTAAEIFVCIPPQKYFVDRITGGDIKVNILVEPGQDPHTFDIKPKQLMQFSDTKVYFSIGLEFERVLINRIKNVTDDLKIVNLNDNVKSIRMISHTHHHGHDHHDEGEPDPHVWLSPSNVISISRNILDILTEIYPDKEDIFRENYIDFVSDIKGVQRNIKNKLSGLNNRSFLVYHPAWGYFAREFNLQQHTVEIEGKEPKPQDLIDLIKLVENENFKKIFMDPGQSARAPEIIASQAGIELEEADPLAQNWLENLINFAEKLAE